jgi:hypothetical protein
MDASAYYYTANLLLINTYREASERMMFMDRPLTPLEAITHHNLQSAVMRIMRYQELLTENLIKTVEEIKYAEELPECTLDEPASDSGEEERDGLDEAPF